MFGPWRQYSFFLISVNKVSDAVRKKCLKKWRNFDVEEQPIIIKLCVFVMEMANKHDGNDITVVNNNIKAIKVKVKVKVKIYFKSGSLKIKNLKLWPQLVCH